MDDLEDHWRTKDHRVERTRLLKDLINAAEKGNFRITILSGDVHIGCAGIIYDRKRRKNSNAAVIHSLISSAVVNVPPPATVVQMLELTGGEIESVESNNEWDIRAGLTRFSYDPRKSRYIPGRNYLELRQDTKKGILCRWISEGQEDKPYELYIESHKVGKGKLFNMKLLADDTKYITQTLANIASLPVHALLENLFGGGEKKITRMDYLMKTLPVLTNPTVIFQSPGYYQ